MGERGIAPSKVEQSSNARTNARTQPKKKTQFSTSFRLTQADIAGFLIFFFPPSLESIQRFRDAQASPRHQAIH